MLDPTDRRHRYPFINCTNCCPRLTFTRSVSYDPDTTIVSGFEMCYECRKEHDEPSYSGFRARLSTSISVM